MHTQKDWCAGVDAYDGYYLLVAKKNQPGVRQDLLEFFEDKALDQGEWDYHKTVKKDMDDSKCEKSGQARR